MLPAAVTDSPVWSRKTRHFDSTDYFEAGGVVVAGAAGVAGVAFFSSVEDDDFLGSSPPNITYMSSASLRCMNGPLLSTAWRRMRLASFKLSSRCNTLAR